MRKLIGGFSLFVAGVFAGAFLMQPGSAQQNQAQQTPIPGLRLNHVGIYAKDYEESMRFYTKTLGLKEAFTIKDQNGKPTLTYLHITRDTFLELAPATAERPAGLSHIGIWPEDLNGTVAALRLRGATMVEPRVNNKTSITNLVDPNGVRLEFLDFLPDSLPRQAMDSWKK